MSVGATCFRPDASKQASKQVLNNHLPYEQHITPLYNGLQWLTVVICWQVTNLAALVGVAGAFMGRGMLSGALMGAGGSGWPVEALPSSPCLVSNTVVVVHLRQCRRLRLGQAKRMICVAIAGAVLLCL